MLLRLPFHLYGKDSVMAAYIQKAHAWVLLPGLIFAGLLHAGDRVEKTVSVERPSGGEVIITQTLRRNDDGSYTIVRLEPEDLAADVYGEICAESGARYVSPDETEVRISGSAMAALVCESDDIRP